MALILKVMFADELRRVRLPQDDAQSLTYDLVSEAIAQVWPDLPAYTARYRDCEGDLCTLTKETVTDFVRSKVATSSETILKLELYANDKEAGPSKEEPPSCEDVPSLLRSWLHVYTMGFNLDRRAILKVEGPKALATKIKAEASAMSVAIALSWKEVIALHLQVSAGHWDRFFSNEGTERALAWYVFAVLVTAGAFCLTIAMLCNICLLILMNNLIESKLDAFLEDAGWVMKAPYLGRLALHPQHLKTPGRPCPLVGLSPAPEKVERVRELSRMASRAFQHLESGELPEALRCQVLRSRDDLVLRRDGCEDVHVPFLLAEVGYAQRETGCIVAFGRCVQPLTGELEAEEYEVWLIVVTGGDMALQTFLNVLSKGGVVRGDIERECSVTMEPFAFGGSSKIYKWQRIIRTEHGKNELGREMAAKALPARRPSDVSRVDEEVAMLLKARGHPNIINFRGIFFCGSEGLTSQLAGKAVLLTDYYMRGSLWSCVKRDGTFAEGEGLGLMAGVLSALAHIHEKGIVHRDVKSENILLDVDGRAILTDFGIACSVLDAKAMQGRCGTPGYAAPEVLSDHMKYGRKVDVFGVGVTLYFTIFASTPFDIADGGKSEILRRTRECNVTFPGNRAMTAQMKRIVLMLLSKDPEDRPTAKMAMQIIELVDHAKPFLAAAPALPGAAFEIFDPAAPAESTPSPSSPKTPLRPVPPSSSPGPKSRMPNMRRFFSKASEPEGAPKPRSEDAPSPLASPVPCWSSDGSDARGTPSTGSASGSAACSRSGSLSPGWSVKTSSKASSGSRKPRAVPSLDKMCPSFLKRRSKVVDAPLMESVVP